MRLRTILITVFLATSGTALADSIDISLSNDSAQAIYATDWRTAEFNMGVLYNNDKNNGQNDWVASAGLLAQGEQQSGGSRIEAGLGGKTYLASIGNQDLLALGLGGQLRVFPNNGIFGIGGYVFYAPDIVTVMDGKKFWETGVRAEMEIIKKTASLYLGYRKVRADLDNGTHVVIDKGAHAGVKILF
ncbi:MAG: hypothetical protein AAB134_03455 [Pseudomonadota bacterium]